MASIRKITDGAKFIEARHNLGNVDICPLCKESFRTSSTTSVWLIVSNQDGMPNRILHDECVQECGSPGIDESIGDSAIRRVQVDWEEAKHYVDWFPTY